MLPFVRRPSGALAMMWAAAVVGFAPATIHADGRQRTGFAAHYRPGLMEKVARQRGLEVVACMVASPHHKIGVWLSIHSPKRKQTLKCRVTDVPQKAHRPALIRKGIVVELDFESAKILCGIKRPREAPPSACKVVTTVTTR